MAGSVARRNKRPLPSSFGALVKAHPPRAIRNDEALEANLALIDDLMASGGLTKDQEVYLETLVELVEVYEARRHAIEVSELSGLAVLRHLLEENGMNASDLARLLGVHASMGSKILKGQRRLTVAHVRELAKRFAVSPTLFIE